MDNKTKKIAQNTIFMTLRMFFLLIVTFFMSRVVLDKLGVEDYGIYNLISSLALSFTFFSSALTNATQRFITIELAKQNIKAASAVFNQHLLVYTIISVVIIVIAEVVGIWMINTELSIPDSRIWATHIVYQFAILTVVVSLLSIVFESLIISHEDMKIYSYVGVIEGVLKLGVAYAIIVSPIDKLIFYSALMALIFLLSRIVYVGYCFKHYEECFLQKVWNKALIQKTSKFIGWNVLSTAQVAICDQGISILLNMFFGPIANAARGITSQVGGAVFKFVNSFLIAAQPQIVKSYAQNDTSYLKGLFYSTSRLSYVVLWLFVCPIVVAAEEILAIWLVDVPKWTADMVRISLIGSCFYVLSKPIWFIIIADGRLKKYTLVSSTVAFMLFPLSYVALKMGYDPVSVYILSTVLHGLNIFFQLHVLREYVDISYFIYAKSVIGRIFLMSMVSYLSCSLLYCPQSYDISAFINIVCITLLNAFIVFATGLTNNERNIVFSKVRKILQINKE